MLYKYTFRKIDTQDWFCGPGSLLLLTSLEEHVFLSFFKLEDESKLFYLQSQHVFARAEVFDLKYSYLQTLYKEQNRRT